MAPSEKMNEITRLVEQYGNDVLRTAFVILKSENWPRMHTRKHFEGMQV